MMIKKKVLVLCTGNSCRSQMAEGYLKYFTEGKAEIYSAGIETHGLNQDAVRVMKKDGIDISMQTSNLIDEYKNMEFDFVITVCDHARENCPYFPTEAKKIHQNFPDPSKTSGTEEEINRNFINTRNLIKSYCRKFAEENL
ncbi:arsenate reductase ArsC [Chryseobacterium sp. MIQD13]|uniref:arsenate reductase ArsC n=1 Tax=Chryseobacterium sp. MIQD13 TaxID=3422310 RepID=UPI003D27B4EC